MNKQLAMALTVISLTACGGGGGGSSPQPPPPPPPTGGGTPAPAPDPVFEPYQNFSQQCADPRTGVDARGRPFPDTQGATIDENNWLRSWSNELYLWYDEIIDVDPASLSTPDYFEQMQTFELTASGAPKDKFHFTMPSDEYLALSQSGSSSGYGATFALLSASPPRQLVIAYTEPDTPATSPEVNLTRGVTVLEIDGEDVINGNDVDTLNGGLFPGEGETHTFVIEELDGVIRSVTMTSQEIISQPVQNVSTLETNNGVVGYLTFNDHIRPAEAQLFAAVEELKAANISDLVLDVRYNGGGFLSIANELAYMITGPVTASGKTFEARQFNDKHPNFDPVTGDRLDPELFHEVTQGFSLTSGVPLPSLNLSRVFVLTGSGTCSASESIMNSLRGVDVEVIQIGTTTCGKPYGFYPFDNCGTTYFSIQFRGINDKGFGDYTDGFSPENVATTEGVPLPGCLVSDDFTRLLGDPDEGRFKAALQYREDGTCPTTLANARLKPLPHGQQPLHAANGQVLKSVFLTNRIIEH